MMSSQKERIVREAAQMFLAEGVKSVRMDDIAARLGISKRTLYEMFGDKRDLLEQSVAHHFEGKRDAIFEKLHGAANVVEELFIVLSTIKRSEKDEALVESLQRFYPDIHDRFEEEAYRFSSGEFDRLLEQGKEQGLFLPDLDKDIALATLLYLKDSLTENRSRFKYLRATASAGHSSTARLFPSIPLLFEYVLINFFRGLSTHVGIEVIDELIVKYRKP